MVIKAVASGQTATTTSFPAAVDEGQASRQNMKKWQYVKKRQRLWVSADAMVRRDENSTSELLSHRECPNCSSGGSLRLVGHCE